MAESSYKAVMQFRRLVKDNSEISALTEGASRVYRAEGESGDVIKRTEGEAAI